MPAFSDRISLRFLDDTFLEALVGQLGLPALFAIAFELREATVHDVQLTGVRRRKFQVPVFETVRTHGSEDHLASPPKRIRLDRQQPRAGRLGWVDVLVELEVRAVLERRATPPERMDSKDLLAELGDPADLDELRTALEGRFGPSVAEEALERLSVTSIEEFRRRAPRLVELVGEPPPPFDPNDPASAESFPLLVCFRLEPELDIAGALRQAQLSRSLLEAERQYVEVYGEAEVRRPYAFVSLFPASAATGGVLPGLSPEELRTQTRALFAAEEMAAHFVADN